MAKQVFPTFGICNLVTNKSRNDVLAADRFKGYLENNPHLQAVHRHSFYHLVYFTEGSGEHIIDFVHFPVQKGMIYFMKPGQVHNWHFSGSVDGYIVNFASAFFDQLFIQPQLVDQFSFFGTDVQQQVILLKKAAQQEAVLLLEKIVEEQSNKKDMGQVMIATLLLQLFMVVHRDHPIEGSAGKPAYNTTLLRNFERLVDDNFRRFKLPKEYAAMLYITPNHLNALSKDVLGKPAGELIRDRIVLEAKRLLVNVNLSIGDIAQELNFPDNSYFTRFFKKYTSATPEAFRSQHYKS
jgi:AraC-like DNA-binding protein